MDTAYKAFIDVATWELKASRCIYRLRGMPGDIRALLKSTCVHKKRIGRNCSMANCPLSKSNDEKPKELIKSIW